MARHGVCRRQAVVAGDPGALRLDLICGLGLRLVIDPLRQFLTGSNGLETDLSAQPAAPGQDTRFPRAHENSRRSASPEKPAPKGPLSPNSMKASLAPQAFPKESRLLRRGEFRRVYEEGQRRSTSLCAIFFRPNGLSWTRLGITAPARLGSAVVRNRAKRRLREVFRRHCPALPPGWDIVLNPRAAVAEVQFPALVREILRLFPNQAPPRSSVESGSQ